MSEWRKKLRPASFRGVPFNIRSADSEVGRRSVLIEYPQRDDADSEDMGRRARRFHVEALIVGTDYFGARDKLIEALETAGPGELVHPFYGRRTVVLDGPVRISETFEEGGLARFSVDFVEAGKDTVSIAQPDTRSRIKTAAEAARAATGADFAERYNIAGQPSFVANSALAMAQTAISKMAALRNMIPDLSSASAWLSTSNGVSSELATLIASPARFSDSVQALIGGARGLSDNPKSAIKELSGLFGFGKESAVSYSSSGTSAGGTAVGAIETTATPARVQEAANTDAVARLVQQTALIEACDAVSEVEFSTLDEAMATRAQLVEQLDVLASTTESDTVYSTLVAVRVAVVQDIATRGTRLPQLGSLTLPATAPAVVVAYRIYGDATRDEDLLARNPDICHPGFVPAGQALQILIDS